MNILISKVIKWHKERNLIDGATDGSQSLKLYEEFLELVASLQPGTTSEDIAFSVVAHTAALHKKGKIKPVTFSEANHAKKDALGDMLVVMINIAERNGWSMKECLAQAYEEIEHRKGILWQGEYIKSEDPHYEAAVAAYEEQQAKDQQIIDEANERDSTEV